MGKQQLFKSDVMENLRTQQQQNKTRTKVEIKMCFVQLLKKLLSVGTYKTPFTK